MTKTVQLEDGTIVTGTVVKTTSKTPAKLKVYQIKESCPRSWKGKQRQEVVNVMVTQPDRFWTREEIAKAVSDKYPTKFEVPESVGYHLHQLDLLGHVESK